MKKYLLSIFTLITPFLTFAQEEEVGLDTKIDQAFAPVAQFFTDVIFFPIYQDDIYTIPFVLVLLVGSALFFTIYFGFPNIRYFWTAINTVRGKYEDIEKHGAKELYGEGGIAQGQDLSNVDIEEHLISVENESTEEPFPMVCTELQLKIKSSKKITTFLFMNVCPYLQILMLGRDHTAACESWLEQRHPRLATDKGVAVCRRRPDLGGVWLDRRRITTSCT